MERFRFILRLYKRYGIRGVLFLFTSRFRKVRTENIKIRGVKHPITLSNFKEDVGTLSQVFFSLEYKINKKLSPQFIIDCGANIGLSAVYFANKYPNATIIAVEPDFGNFTYLELNSKLYPNIICLNRAIWSKPVHMAVVDPGRGGWGLRTVEAAESSGLESITIDQIMDQYQMDRIDLLKIDIEGAEKELFTSGYESWLLKTHFLAIELHDFIEPGISETFFKAIEPFSYEEHSRGENFICEFKGLKER